jgi:hypothetical protein
MKSLICAVAIVLVCGAAVDAAQGQGRGRGQGNNDPGASDTAKPAQVNVVFSQRDVTLIRSHYGNRFRNLPPGLQKKLARGGSLPPGWEKKIEAFPAALERDLVVLGPNRKYGIYDGHAVIYNPLTHAILDIISLF